MYYGLLGIQLPSDTALLQAHALTFHPVYRVSQFYQFMILVLAVYPLIYFMFFKVLKSNFHGNLKWLLAGYFGTVSLFTFLFLGLASIQVLIPFFALNKCDLLIPKDYYKLGNFLGCFLMTAPTFFPISITFERFLATKKANDYEKSSVILGPIVTFLVMYTFFSMMLVLNVFNFILTFFLIKMNSKTTKMNSTLTARYQLEEVYQSTKFAISVIFVHVVFYGAYISLTILSKYFGALLITDPIDLSATRGLIMTMIPTYNFVIGVAAIYFYREVQKKKQTNMIGNIRMEATGNAGAQNYENAISTIWNSIAVTPIS